MTEVHIILTRKEVLISRKPYASWREIQDEFDDYVASLGPWDTATATSWLDEEYSGLSPSAQDQIGAFLYNEQAVRSLSFVE
ncbi:hypothetical protein [Janthinobacterium lividum]|uniref:Uncharacterized protein n=1 Tax=Janthinobacterium lividum TaxID=29581 RepID=A0ABU0XMW3_9BURK|nr:hypothetical protein [Janthinobacterium lividum]MDQ4624854.1 hypothetical protein [Janthinobacterium lividum]MDQ4673543.1 hypothetical protein [Janthinobacterium lividum]MDQ4684273.1 hypothetical protein [Janthinobacterium lividum]